MTVLGLFRECWGSEERLLTGDVDCFEVYIRTVCSRMQQRARSSLLSSPISNCYSKVLFHYNCGKEWEIGEIKVTLLWQFSRTACNPANSETTTHNTIDITIPSTTMSTSHSEDVRTIQQAKQQLLESSFGKEKATKVKDINQQLEKAIFEARQNQVKAQRAIFDQRKEIIQGIDKVCRCIFRSKDALFLVERETCRIEGTMRAIRSLTHACLIQIPAVLV
jgi:hypothetical protein